MIIGLHHTVCKADEFSRFQSKHVPVEIFQEKIELRFYGTNFFSSSLSQTRPALNSDFNIPRSSISVVKKKPSDKIVVFAPTFSYSKDDTGLQWQGGGELGVADRDEAFRFSAQTSLNLESPSRDLDFALTYYRAL